MRLLTVPNWSFGRNRALLRRFTALLDRPELTVHFLRSDIDHNRTITAFSGEEEHVLDALIQLTLEAFDSIDLNNHVGVHPRIGALDVCPFIPLERTDAHFDLANAIAERFAATVGGRFQVPVFLYEKSERGRGEGDLASLRKGGFGALLGRKIRPDFGPELAHKTKKTGCLCLSLH